MAKIQMKTPLVEMDGDEMTRIIWKMIKDILLIPYIDLKTEYYDLGLEYRNSTNDKVTVDSAEATKKYGVAVKCATITPNAARMTEYDLKEMWKSPNGTIRAILDGTVFRTPIIVKGITPYIPTWTKPITIARHAYGDVYKNTEMKIEKGSKCELVSTDKNGNETRELIFNFSDTDGVIQGMHNTDKSIESFARSCFNYALDMKQDIWFASKDTISKKYDHRFKDIFAEIYEAEYKEKFEQKYPNGVSVSDIDYSRGSEALDDLAVISYTSGTSSAPKGVMLLSKSLSGNIRFARDYVPTVPGGNTFSILPLAHIFGLSLDFLFLFSTGCHIHIFSAKPVPALLLKALGEVKPFLFLQLLVVLRLRVRLNFWSALFLSISVS